MNTFRIKAYAKINLGLDVLRRRPDGYHEVKMIMQTVDLYDDLEFTKLAEDEIRIFTDKEELPADQGNLIWRAAARMPPPCWPRFPRFPVWNRWRARRTPP